MRRVAAASAPLKVDDPRDTVEHVVAEFGTGAGETTIMAVLSPPA